MNINSILLLILALPISVIGQKPSLGLPYGHTDIVHSMLFSADGTLLLSGGEDQSLKLWDVKSGKLLRTSPKLNGAVLPGLSASEDMRFVRYSRGWTDARFWVFDFNNPEDRGIAADDFDGPPLSGTLGTHLDWDLAAGYEIPDGHELEDISPDGKYLLLTSITGRVKLYDPVKKDTVRIYNLPGESQESYIFNHTADSKISPDGQMVARGREDGTIYLQDLQTGKLIRTLQAHTWPLSFLQFGTDNTTLICATQEGRARVWDLKEGRIRASVGSRKLQSLYSDVFLPISEHELFSYRGNGSLEHFDLATGQIQKLHQVSTEGHPQLRGYIPAAQIAYFASLDETFNPVLQAYDLSQSPPEINLLPPVKLTGTSPDGQLGASFELVNVQDSRQLTAQLWKMPGLEPLKNLEPAPASYMNAQQVIFSADQRKLLMLTDFELMDGTKSYVWDIPSGRLEYTIAEPEDSYATAGALSPDGRFLLLGCWSHSVHWYDLNTGQLLHTFTGHSGRINALAFSSDSKRIASGSDDGTIKIWDLDTKEEIATLLNIDREDWIVLGRNGLFDASQHAMNLLYYTVDDGRKLEIIELEQLKSRYYEPGLLQKLMGYSDERIRPVENLEAVKLYPNIETNIVQGSLQIVLQERNGGIGKVSIFINGKEVVEEANPLPRSGGKRESNIRYDLKPYQNYLFRHPDSTNIISVRAYNEEGWLKSPAIELEYQLPAARTRGSGSSEGGSAWVGQVDPKLYVVSIGTSNYTGTKLDLQYADQDATMMARALASVGTALFTNGNGLEVHCLSTARAEANGLEGTGIHWQFADKNNIEAVFKSIQQKARAEDVILVYLSGHGVTYGGAEQARFHYLTQGIASEDLSDAAIRKAYTISSEELTEWINDIPALKQVLIIDACNSGQIVENLTGGTKALNSSQIRALDRMKDRTGMFVLSGSASDKVSYEASEYGQGLLTYALLQGMLGVATRQTADGNYIDVMKLFQHARDEVPRLAATINGIQTPMLGFPQTGASFDIGIVDENAKIPIGRKKPVMIRSNFLNQVTLKDDLGLVKLLEAEFRKETEKGKDADLIYVDVTDYPGAYSLNGLYTKNGGNVNISIKLFENGENVKDLEIPTTDDVERLVRLILREVKRAITDPGN